MHLYDFIILFINLDAASLISVNIPCPFWTCLHRRNCGRGLRLILLMTRVKESTGDAITESNAVKECQCASPVAGDTL